MATGQPGQPRDGDPAVQQVIDLLERSGSDRTDPGGGWFTEAMRGMMDILLAQANDVGPSSEELERLWDAVFRLAVEHPEQFRGFSADAENAALSVRLRHWGSAAWRRSVLEFLRENPRFAAFGEALTDEDLADIDDPLREAAEDVEPLPAHMIPNGLPASHWWWWAPSARCSD